MPLNEHQARAVTATLRHCEQTLRQMEQLLAGDAAAAERLVRWRWDLPPEQRAALAVQLRGLRQDMTRVAEEWGLEPEERNGTGWVRGQLAAAWVALDELSGRKLAGYGPLAPDVAQTLLPRLGDLAAEVQAALHALTPPIPREPSSPGQGEE